MKKQQSRRLGTKKTADPVDMIPALVAQIAATAQALEALVSRMTLCHEQLRSIEGASAPEFSANFQVLMAENQRLLAHQAEIRKVLNGAGRMG